VKPLLFAFLAGVAAAAGFQPLGLWPLALAAFAMLIGLVDQAPALRSALLRGWLFGLGYFILGLNWIATSFTYQGNMPAWLGWIAVVLLSLYLAVYPAVAAGLGWRFGRDHRLALVLAFAAAWIVTEWLRAGLFTGFAWNPLGAALVATPLVKAAVIVGTYGLSGLAVLVVGAVWLLYERELRSGTALAILTSMVVGLGFLASPSISSGTGIKLRIVQPNIGQEDKWRAGYMQEAMRRLARMSAADPGDRRLLLWPEMAVTPPMEDGRQEPYFQVRALETREAVGRLLEPTDLLLTGGGTVQSVDGYGVSSATNSIFAVRPDGGIIARYDKAHLVPYGEYLPMRPLLSALGLSRLAPGDIDFAPGPGARSIELPGIGLVGFQLCYEIIFSGEVVERDARPRFLFNPSNDAWFGAWGPPQHLAQARLRAVEEGLPVLRATPTGISAVIDADGRVRASLPWRRAGVIDSELPAPKPATPFARYGNLLPLAFALLLALGVIAVRRKAG
jgi:apolipoprotein N-acyltransferase